VKPKGARGGVHRFLEPLPQGRGLLPLGEPKAGSKGWRKLLVRVSEGKVSVAVDDGPKMEFELAWLEKADPKLKGSTLRTRGALGVWVRNGVGSFRNATVMPLAK
jgi:hypothetical protein